MKFAATILVALSALASAAPSATKQYYLKTAVTYGDKKFNNLYLGASHSGAGLNDALFSSSKKGASVGYLVKTNATATGGHSWYNQQFNLSSGQYPYSLVLSQGINNYAGWQPSAINTYSISNNGYTTNGGYFINSTGLQWVNDPYNPETSDFVGWLVCSWWRGAPQLFWKLDELFTNSEAPDSCASVNLIPEYL